MTPAEGKAVWLLGSGFSAPLGGPLLSDLFRQETKEEILPFFPEKEFPDLAESLPWIQSCFHFGHEKGLWRNAEQYLAYVDDAYRGGNTAKHGRLRSLIMEADPHKHVLNMVATDPTRYRAHYDYRERVIDSFGMLVKRGLASEVSRFLIQSPPNSEPWSPYVRWVNSLRPGFDTVVSFNYDKVVETAVKEAGIESKVWFGMPHKEVPKDKVPVLKLHGSVGWWLKTDSTSERRQTVERANSGEDLLRRQDVNIAIAAPGGTKSDFVSTHFDSLWTHAGNALNSAANLYVVGYSFPDTDPTAQYRLLDAFAAGSVNPRAAHIVLGSDVTPASRRVLSLIRSTAIPSGPSGPDAPTGPAGPCAPGGPASPFAPVGPWAPEGPVGPVGP